MSSTMDTHNANYVTMGRCEVIRNLESFAKSSSN